MMMRRHKHYTNTVVGLQTAHVKVASFVYLAMQIMQFYCTCEEPSSVLSLFCPHLMIHKFAVFFQNTLCRNFFFIHLGELIWTP